MNMQNNQNAMYTVYFALYGKRDNYGAEIVYAMLKSVYDLRIRKIRVELDEVNTAYDDDRNYMKKLSERIDILQELLEKEHFQENEGPH